MGLIELFNQWIVERGSAVVQEKHLALFRDQLATADAKTAKLESENSILQHQINQLKLDLEETKNENGILKEQIRNNEKNSHTNDLEEIKKNILLFLSKHDESYVNQLASAIKVGPQTAQFHLEELSDSGMVDMSCYFGGETSWYLAQSGRKYLVRNNLIT